MGIAGLSRTTSHLSLFLLAIAHLATVPASADVQRIDLPSAGVSFAIAPETGAIAAVTGSDDVVKLYPDLSARLSTAKVLTRTVGSNAIAVVHKRLGDKSLFLVLCQGDRSLHLLDAATLQPAGKPIALSGEQPICLVAPSSADAPYAFYCAGREMDGRAHRVDLRNERDEGRVETMEGIGEISISADARILYGRRPGTSPSGVRAWQILSPAGPEAPIRAAVLTNEHDTSQTYYPDPLGQYCAFGRILHSADLTRKVAKFEVAPVCFFPGRPLIVGLEGSKLVIYSYNTFKPLSNLTLDELGEAGGGGSGGIINGNGRAPSRAVPRGGNANRYFIPTVLPDPRNARIVVCRDRTASVIALTDLNLPAEPLLYASVDGPRTATVGQDLTFKLTPGDANVKIELNSAPQGLRMAVGGDTLTWTPGSADIGTQKVVLKLFAGDAQRLQEFEVAVRQSGLDLPFVPDEMQLAPDAKALVILAHSSDVRRASVRYEGPQTGCQLAIIDPQRLTVTARRTLALNLHAVAIDSRYVYLPQFDSDAFYVLSRNDLSDVKRVFTAGRVRQLVSVGDAYLFVASGDRNTIAQFKLPDLTPLDLASAAATRPVNQQGYIEPPSSPPPARVGDDAWLHRGVLYDAEFKKVRMLVMPEGAIPLFNRDVGNIGMGVRFDQFGRPQPAIAPWGAVVNGGSIQRLAGQSVGRLTGVDVLMLNDIPAVVTLDYADAGNRGRVPNAGAEQRERVVLNVRDLVTAGAPESILLSDEPIPRGAARAVSGYPGGERVGRLAAAPGTLVAQYRERLFVLPTKSLAANALPAPLHFLLDQPSFVLDPAKPVSFTAKAQGGSGRLEFSTTMNVPGMSVEKTDGRVTFDPQTLRKSAVEALMNNFRNVYAPTGPEQMLAAYMRAVSPVFTAVAGRPPTGPVVFVPVPLSVRDAEQQAANFEGGLLLEVPMREVVERIRTLREENRAASAAIAAANAAAVAATQPSSGRNSAAGAGEVAALRQRIADLEKRNQQLEAQVELLKDMVRQNSAERKKP